MKLIFEGKTALEIFEQIDDFLQAAQDARVSTQEIRGILQETSTGLSTEPVEPQGPSPEPKPQKAKRGAKAKVKTPEPEVPEVPEVEADETDETEGSVLDAAPPAEEQLDPATLMTIRNRTIEDLQSAYAGGKQKAVFDLLAKFGNGAKSFRELTVNEFVPIRKAIDEGALT